MFSGEHPVKYFEYILYYFITPVVAIFSLVKTLPHLKKVKTNVVKTGRIAPYVAIYCKII